jgi:hypothetical protein
MRNVSFIFTILAVTVLFVSAFGIQEADASHFRFGHVNWEENPNSPGMVTFGGDQAWRGNSFGSLPSIGDVVGSTSFLNFGDGTGGESIYVKVEAVNPTDNWLFGKIVDQQGNPITHTYAGDGPYTAYFDSCCRIGGLSSSGSDYRVESVVNLVNDNTQSPKSAIPPIVFVPANDPAATFIVPAIDANGDSLSFRISTPLESGINVQGPYTVDSNTGLVTINTSGKGVGTKWATSITIEETQNPMIGKVTVDFITQVGTATIPPEFVSPTPASGTEFEIPVGQPFSFDLKCQDLADGDTVTISGLSLPDGSTINPANPSGTPIAQGTFNWTPDSTQVAAMTFTCRDQNLGSAPLVAITIRVVEAVTIQPISEIQCSYDEQTEVFQNQTTLDYTVNGSCDVYRGDDMEMKNMTLNVFKEFNLTKTDTPNVLTNLEDQPIPPTCSDQTGIFTINFDDESGSVTVNEEGEICETFGFLNFTGTNTSVQGTGEYEDIGPQCGDVDAEITSSIDYASENSIKTHTIPSSSASGSVSINQCQEIKKSGGGDNQWDTRPTFGISHEDRGTQVVENGFRFNTNEYMLTDNHHTDFAEQEVEIGTMNSFSATVYADKKLKVQEFLFGIPNVGEAHLAELGVEVWYDRDGNIDDIQVVQKSNVIDADTLSVSHEKTKCLSTDPEPLCDTTTVSMTFLEPLLDKVMAIKAIDYALRDQRTFLNEGFDISGESLNPMLEKMIPSNVKNQGLLKVTQMAKYSPYWTSEDGRIFEMNSFGSFKEINQTFERFQDTGNAFTRMHSGFGGILDYEQKRATDLFDASQFSSELPESFAYIYPDTGERITDEMLKEMQIQAEIAQKVLDEMDKQNRHH